MSYLPQQEDPVGTYYEIDSIKDLIDENDATQDEGQTAGVWIMILFFTFPLLQGYSIIPQRRVAHGVLDVLMVHKFVRNNATERARFFVVECKRAQLETQTAAWTTAAGQLIDYLDQVTHRANAHTDTPHPVYGAIAIGKYVRIYEYFRSTGTIRNVIATPQDQSPYLHVGRQCRTVQNRLNIIEGNH